ncbi:MAG TPA: cyclopropane-fatty-acyl-phospholipid synthase family protein [Solirubrobacterales bacterium]|nr:cyclopropane-fatty-acyl-phospholipid synthase family protein [Solirubrobacterales bacterium]
MRAGADPWRRVVYAVLRRIEAGSVELVERFPSGVEHRFGPDSGPLQARVEVRDPGIYRRIARSRSVALGQTYAEGLWETDDLVALLRIAARDIGRADPLRRRLAPLLVPLQRLATLPMLNTRRGARSNVAAHYDLGNEMFELFLDREAMMYSSAYFETGEETLERAQHDRLERVCEALELRPSDHLLEIGTGWGGMAVHAASTRGCRVTTTTISREQREYAEARVAAAGLEDRIAVIGADYRDLTGSFDKLVSLEMIEAVGWEWFDAYFRDCSRLIGPAGLFFLQAIVMTDGAYELEKRTRTFTNQVIFPGGCLPSVASIQRSIARETDLRTVALEDISPSYVLTLRAWRERFEAASERLEELGYDERFRRTWRFYLAASEAGFAETRIRDVQMLFAKPCWSGKPEHVAGAGGRATRDPGLDAAHG